MGWYAIARIIKPKVIIEVRNENKNFIQNYFKEYDYKLFSIDEKKSPLDLNKTNIENVINIYAEKK